MNGTAGAGVIGGGIGHRLSVGFSMLMDDDWAYYGDDVKRHPLIPRFDLAEVESMDQSVRSRRDYCKRRARAGRPVKHRLSTL